MFLLKMNHQNRVAKTEEHLKTVLKDGIEDHNMGWHI